MFSNKNHKKTLSKKQKKKQQVLHCTKNENIQLHWLAVKHLHKTQSTDDKQKNAGVNGSSPNANLSVTWQSLYTVHIENKFITWKYYKICQPITFYALPIKGRSKKEGNLNYHYCINSSPPLREFNICTSFGQIVRTTMNQMK